MLNINNIIIKLYYFILFYYNTIIFRDINYFSEHGLYNNLCYIKYNKIYYPYRITIRSKLNNKIFICNKYNLVGFKVKKSNLIIKCNSQGKPIKYIESVNKYQNINIIWITCL